VIVSYWTDITPAVVITVALALILAINLTSVRFYGETEVIGGAIKVLCFIGLIIVSIVITAGGGPNHEVIGFRYWHNPGAWTDYNGITGPKGHFLGFLSAFVNAAFSFIGIETVVISAAESIDPHRAIPKAAERVTYRIGFFYILGALLIGLIVDPQNPDLVSGSGNANSSPWVIAIKQAGISVLPSIVNACILVSAWSAGNSYCWVGSRMIVAMTTDRQLPQFFGWTTKQGVPWVAVITAWLFGPLAYLSKSGLRQRDGEYSVGEPTNAVKSQVSGRVVLRKPLPGFLISARWLGLSPGPLCVSAISDSTPHSRPRTSVVTVCRGRRRFNPMPRGSASLARPSSRSSLASPSS
jgi:amino acid transporter